MISTVNRNLWYCSSARRSVASAAAALAVLGTAVTPASASPATNASPPTKHATVIDSLTTDRSETVRNANGTYTLKVSSLPVRVRTTQGWQPIDTTLMRAPDGWYVPRAAEVNVRFGGGDTRDLLTVQSGSTASTVQWPTVLPRPVVHGSTVTYRNVRPGVDLVGRAEATTFSAVLVVRSASAATNPALSTLTMSTATASVRQSAEVAGANPTALARSGSVVWDSSGPRGLNTQWEHNTGALAANVTSRGSVTVVQPPKGWLTDERRHFPAYVSVPFTAAPATGMTMNTAGGNIGKTPTEWTSVDEPYTTSTTGDYNTGNVARVGYESQDYMTYRSFFEFGGLSSMAGSTVLSAEFDITEVWAWSCSARSVELWRTGGITNTTTWSTQPGWMSLIGSQDVAYGYSSACPAKALGWSFKSLAQALASAGSAAVGFGMKASSETDTYGWKKFDSGATIAITYDFAPSTPVGMKTDTTTGCVTSPPTPLGTTSPTLSVVSRDKDTADGLATTFEWQKTDGTMHASHTLAVQAQGTASYTLPAGTWANNATWEWRAHSSDGVLSSPSSPWCAFAVDSTPPPVVATISSPSIEAGANVLPGYPQTFDFAAPSGSGVAGYYYCWGDAKKCASSVNPDGGKAVGATAQASAYVPVSASGLSNLFVEPYNSAGVANTSNPAEYTVTLGALDPRADWTFEMPDPSDATGTKWENSAGPSNDLTLSGAAQVADDQTGSGNSALFLNTSPSSVPGQALSDSQPLDTSLDSHPGSFTVIAKVRPTQASISQLVPYVIASQDGQDSASWVLDRTASGGKPVWRFALTDADSMTPNVSAQAMIPVDTAHISPWVTLIASYDAGLNKISLWVWVPGASCDSPTAAGCTQTVAGTVTFEKDEPLRVGAIIYRQVVKNYWNGAIDDVQILQGAIDSSTVNQLTESPPPA